MNDLVAYTQVGELAVITINNPPVNALSPGVPEGIAAGIERANIERRVLVPEGRQSLAGGGGFAEPPETIAKGSPALKGRETVLGLTPFSGLGNKFRRTGGSAKPPPPAKLRLCLRHEELCRRQWRKAVAS